MSKTVGPWTVVSERTAFKNPWIQVEDSRVIHPDGTDGEYGVVRFQNLAIGILPIDDNGDVILIGQHRFPHDAYSWELPEGGGPLGDDPLESAMRELKEETGFTAGFWEPLSKFDVSNSVTDEKSICYLACDLQEGDSAPEPSEQLAMRRVPFTTLLEMVLKGEISDSLTIVMTLTLHARLLRHEAPKPISERIRIAR